MRITGEYEQLGNLDYFIPHKLPPSPTIDMDSEMIALLTDASFHLGCLNEMSHRVPNADRFIKAYVIKEALLSSEIEGIHTTLLNVFTTPTVDNQYDYDTRLVMNYTKAINVAVSMIKNDGFPIVTRVFLKAHEALMTVENSSKSSPGEFRQQSVRVGDLVPPPAHKIPYLISDLENYINQNDDLPELIKIGLTHVQFETIHPFLDGNGRIGRLLIVLMLVNSGYLDAPILYPSYYFKKYKSTYYEKLRNVQLSGDFEGWIKFYLAAIKESCISACRRAKEIEQLDGDLREAILKDKAFSRIHEVALQVLSAFFDAPILGIKDLSETVDKSYNTVKAVIFRFLEMGIITERTNQKRNKLYCLTSYLNILEEDF
ncbi:hypothetical protein FACS1894122_13390 [Alphaproteobacteria bacterium]|nr:hypothetical protein FACS1894122_13390 [Alphaproteobacteria bacterium]